MAFVKIETLDGELEVIAFPRVYEKFREVWAIDSVIEIKGKINARDRDGKPTNDLKVIADSVKLLDSETAKHYPVKSEKEKKGTSKPQFEQNDKLDAPIKYKSVVFKLSSPTDPKKLIDIKKLIKDYSGSVALSLSFEGQVKKLKLPGGINPSKEFLNQAEKIIGKSNIKLEESMIKTSQTL
jgi:DNA polymerase III alpha subunit